MGVSDPSVAPVRLHVRLDADVCGLGGESFWAQPVTGTDDLYLVDNVLFAAPFGLGDTVRAVLNEDDQLQVVAVTARSTRTSIIADIALDVPSDTQPDVAREASLSQVRANLTRHITAEDARVEGGMGTAVVMQCPEHVNGDEVERWLNDAIDAAVSPVMADPAYAGVPLDGLTLNWMPVTGPTDPLGVPPGLIVDLTMSEELAALRPEPAPDWDAGNDLGFMDAVEAVLNAGEMPDWLDAEEFLTRAVLLWRHDTRVRNAVTNSNYADVVTLIIRIAASDRGLRLPPLEQPLFTFD